MRHIRHTGTIPCMQRQKNHVIRHFRRAAPLIHQELARMEWELLSPTEKPAGYFRRLCREIISQQLGSGAARAITGRFMDLFPAAGPTPHLVRAISEKRLRAVGMSWAKARSLRDLAARAEAGDIAFKKFSRADDEEIVPELVRVKGIGRWTAEMFLIFTLGREDVFSHGDLSLQKGLARLYGKGRLRSKKQIVKLVASWSPYRSYASLALWSVMDPIRSQTPSTSADSTKSDRTSNGVDTKS